MLVGVSGVVVAVMSGDGGRLTLMLSSACCVDADYDEPVARQCAMDVVSLLVHAAHYVTMTGSSWHSSLRWC